MRNIYCGIADIRKRVFAEVAKLAYEGGDYRRIDKLPYEILPGEVGNERDSIFLERAIVGERIRLAMGHSIRSASEQGLLSDGVDKTAIREKYYEPPLINIIKYACHACPDTHYEVTNACQHCLAHHCSNSCPKGAISFRYGRAEIDQSKCIKCGRGKAACSYQAIIRFERPCQEACGMDAIGKDAYGRAEIDQDKCVSCGMCLVNCPFGAIVDKGQLFQLIHSIKSGDKVIAVIAPAFWGQFGEQVTPGQIVTAMKMLGFQSVEEVAIGADLCAVEEADEFMRHVPEKQPYMATSCCPAWSVMAKKEFPGAAPYISMTMTPMVLTARLQKKRHPDCKVAFIGPCAAKKLEASRRTVRSDVDFVLTFEELRGMLEAKNIDFANIPDTPASLLSRCWVCGLRRRGQGRGGRDPPSGSGARGKNRVRRGSAGVPQDAAHCPHGEIRRLSAGGHGLPGRLHRRRRHHPAAGKVPPRAGAIQGQRPQIQPPGVGLHGGSAPAPRRRRRLESCGQTLRKAQ